MMNIGSMLIFDSELSAILLTKGFSSSQASDSISFTLDIQIIYVCGVLLTSVNVPQQ